MLGGPTRRKIRRTQIQHRFQLDHLRRHDVHELPPGEEEVGVLGGGGVLALVLVAHYGDAVAGGGGGEVVLRVKVGLQGGHGQAAVAAAAAVVAVVAAAGEELLLERWRGACAGRKLLFFKKKIENFDEIVILKLIFTWRCATWSMIVRSHFSNDSFLGGPTQNFGSEPNCTVAAAVSLFAPCIIEAFFCWTGRTGKYVVCRVGRS